MMRLSDPPVVRILIPVVLMILLATMYVHWNSDFNKVQRRFENLLETASKSGAESWPLMAARTHMVLSFFARDAKIDAGPPFQSRLTVSDLKGMLLNGRRQVTTMKLKALGYEMSTTESGFIQMDTTLDARATAGGHEEKTLGTFRVIWAKVEGDWLITRISPLEIVSHPAGLPMSF